MGDKQGGGTEVEFSEFTNSGQGVAAFELEEEFQEYTTNGATRRRMATFWRKNKQKLFWVMVATLGILIVTVVAIALLRFELRSSDGNGSKGGDNDVNEETLLNSLSAAEIDTHFKYLTSVPHIAGSKADYDQAVYMQTKMKEFGIPSVWIETVPVLLNKPVSALVEIVAPPDQLFKASLEEPPVAEDPTSSIPNPTFHGYAASGDVTAELVYANFGAPSDFDALVARGVNITGKIVIVRYGYGFRGNKAWLAEQHGAVGCLIYSDPKEDGYVRGETYPKGPWRPEMGVQRGSVWTGDGDPLTPGWPSAATGPRLSLDEARDSKHPKMQGYSVLPSIPIHPLSWGDAYRLLKGLGGIEASSIDTTWQGGLNFSYHVGPGPVTVHMKLEMAFNTTNIWNVMGRILGREEPDRLIILGNHRDAWNVGGGDPSLGTAAMLDVAKAFGNLLTTGWRPRRTILFCNWDAEEYALVGSEEFVETHEQILKQQAVIYLNVDVAVQWAQIFFPRGTPQLRQFLKTITDKIPLDPKAHTRTSPMPPGAKVTDIWSPPILRPLGAGSDFTHFLQYLGVACLDLNMVAKDDVVSRSGPYSAIYHSNYDSYHWMTKFGDPGFAYTVLIEKIWALTTLKLTDAVILPFNYLDYAETMSETVVSLEKAGQPKGVQDAFTILKSAIRVFNTSAMHVAGEIESIKTSDVARVRNLNDRLFMVERALLDPKGTLGRASRRHIIFAPGFYNSYAGELMVSVAYPLADKDYKEAIFQILRCSQIIQGAAEVLTGGIQFSQ